MIQPVHFMEKEKKSGFKVLLSKQKYIETFTRLGNYFMISATVSDILKAFISELYDRPLTSSIIDARYKSFCSSTHSHQALPPTKNELQLHIRRCNYRAAINKSYFLQFINAPDSIDHGWAEDSCRNLEVQ